MNSDEMQALIHSVCNEFYQSSGFLVSEIAIDELFKPTIPHLQDVTQKLRNGHISIAFLRQSLTTVLNNARIFAIERDKKYIGFKDVRDSMEKECPYVFWC